jgi:hypothetical protein
VGPVVFFNASTRTWGLSLNAAFSLLASWGLRLGGIPVVHFVCMSGMDQCVLGTVPLRLHRAPPCDLCTRLSRKLFPTELTYPFRKFALPPQGRKLIDEADGIDALAGLRLEGLPLGELCLPSLRWALRRHRLRGTPEIIQVFKQYLASALRIARTYGEFLDEVQPRAAVVFNGVSFPEAVVRAVSQKRGIPVITHEVGVGPLSGFFTRGQATAYPIDIEPGFELTQEENARLDHLLKDRFEGRFTMAGVRFWPEMRSLPPSLVARMNRFRDTVAVFTNVIFDTSQIHANTVFTDMYDWLIQIARFARNHPETLFVIRAHPDELRPGKESLETVEEVLREAGELEQPNVVFVPPREYLSSYELILRSKITMVYNSSVGLEATILGKPVVCGGKARYTQYPTVYFPPTPAHYFKTAEELLAKEAPAAPKEFVAWARRFMYYQHFLTSLDFSKFLSPNRKFPGYAILKDFDPMELHPDRSLEMAILRDGILSGAKMIYRRSGVSGAKIRTDLAGDKRPA